MIFYILSALVLVLITLLPSLWVKRVMKKYHRENDKVPGNARQYLEHLRKEYDIPKLQINAAQNNFYDPTTKAVHLEKQYLESNSLTAITIAAHEFGHALQDKNQEKAFLLRNKLVRVAQKIETVSSIALLLSPIIIFISKSVILGFFVILLGVLPMIFSLLVHFQTLPVEYDASYNKAIKMLENEEFLNNTDIRRSKKILKAAAMTYVAGSLANLVNFWRWLVILRR